MEQPVLLVAHYAGIVTLTLNRPTVRNALDLALARAIATTAQELAQDASLRLVVLRGTPPAFCAGADLTERSKMSPRERTAHTDAIAAAVEAIAELPVSDDCRDQRRLSGRRG
jgi:enoyl-CoA hydratase/carnithine racemase